MRILLFLLVCCCQPVLVRAQRVWSEREFRAWSAVERQRFVHDWAAESLDSAAFLAQFRPLLAVSEELGDPRTVWLLRFKYFQQRLALHLTAEAIREETIQLEAFAAQSGLEVERIVAQHYRDFEAYNAGQMPHEQLYTSILYQLEQMEVLGFEQFKAYQVDKMLFRFGRFMFQLEDFDRALGILLKAEQYADTSAANRRTNVLVLNHIQTIFQQQKNYNKGIEYARKILACTHDCVGADAWCSTWQGIASIDLASMLVGQGDTVQGAQYARLGYPLVRAPVREKTILQTEYDALQVLISVKLDLGQLTEAGALLHRVDSINAVLDRLVAPEYFKHARFYQLYARFFEMKGDYAASVRFVNLAKPLKDSLERRNDARKLEKIQQRLEAERYAERLRLIEQERTVQGWVRNGALALLLVLLALGWVNYRRLQRKRQQALTELAEANRALETFTNNYREKSEQVDHLRQQVEQQARTEGRAEYLEQLTRSTILTDADWVQFKLLFEKVHPYFMEEIKAKHPGLTPAETRLLVLDKLDLNTAEMANMLGVSKNTINQTRLRLRRKLGGGTV